ncbi:ABC transporter ATP-binding protein [Anaeromyxobacter paludicola]|uniref:ABC transporter ATP-binding protein n=1 Tax=Anaeromyxobacter paludicola TaxID=2918171 RepID=UPI0020BDD17D|nr:ABC transporter ATP-binding protein [Anaeromyxobacter paludicola]
MRRFPGGAAVAASLEAAPEGVTVLFGPSGAGKSTVLRCVAGLEAPDVGVIRFDEETWFDRAHGVDVPPQARRVGYVFQDAALFPHLTVEENVRYGARARGAPPGAAGEALERLGLALLSHRRPAELSGGERQRVSLARALASRPRLLLLDEPLSALDAPTREALRATLRDLLAAVGLPALLVTHDRIEALALGDRLAVLAKGRIRQCGPVAEVFARPADLEVAAVVGTENVLPAEVAGEEGGLVHLRVGPAELSAVGPAPGRRCFACFRAEDVLLEAPGGSPTSARNRLAATVRALAPEGPLSRVTLDCGFPLVALVTRRSVEELELAPGRPVLALLKAPAVRLVARAG